MNISDRIEFLRKKRGISLTHLNSEIGAYRGKITEVRKGKASFEFSEIEKIAQALATSTDYLLGATDDPAPAGQKEKPPAPGGEQIPGYDQLTPENQEFVRKQVAFLLAQQQDG